MRRFLAGFFCLALTVAAARAGDRINVDGAGLALQGYDPVGFFADGKAEKGSAAITATHHGATYRFTSEEHRKQFAAEPDRYAPAYGGFCAYAVSRDHTAPVAIETWQIVMGRLMLNYDLKVKALFDSERDANVRKADANWPRLEKGDGK